jgi:hypothetical protein
MLRRSSARGRCLLDLYLQRPASCGQRRKRPTVDRIAKDGIDGFERVKQVDALVSQRGTASASMR